MTLFLRINFISLLTFMWKGFIKIRNLVRQLTTAFTQELKHIEIEELNIEQDDKGRI